MAVFLRHGLLNVKTPLVSILTNVRTLRSLHGPHLHIRSIIPCIGVDRCRCIITKGLSSTRITKFSTISVTRCLSQDTQVKYSSDEEEPDSLFKLVEITAKSHDPTVLDSYQTFVTTAAKELNIEIENIFTPKKVVEKYSQLKSIFVHKKHFVQYETRTHFRVIQLKHLTGSTTDTFLEYIERNLPEGCAMEVIKHKIEALPDHLKPPIKE